MKTLWRSNSGARIVFPARSTGTAKPLAGFDAHKMRGVIVRRPSEGCGNATAMASESLILSGRWVLLIGGKHAAAFVSTVRPVSIYSRGPELPGLDGPQVSPVWNSSGPD
jgi:hypothetical protein